MIRRTTLIAVIAVHGTAFTLAAQAPAPASTQHGINRAYMDTTCLPCRDFFGYANGAWLNSATIPASYSNTGTARELYDRNQATLRRVLDRAAAAADTTHDPALRKVGAFYASCMDSVRANRAGAAPIANELRLIAAIKTTSDLQREIARLMQVQVYAPFYFSAEVDPKESSRYVGQLYQDGLGLPDREYYLKTDPASDSLRRDYVAHVARTLTLLGTPSATAGQDAARVLRLETALAESSMTLVAQRDPAAVYHRMTVRELQTLAPAFEWPAFFGMVGVPALGSLDATLDVSQPAFLRLVSDRAAYGPLEDWRVYLRWQVGQTMAPALGAAFFAEHFRFESRLRGTKEPLPRWKRCAAATDNALGEALGKAYVETEFPPAAKARVVGIVDNLQAAFAERLRRLTWMSDSTRAQAQDKLSKVLRKIGYPDTWRDYSLLTVKDTAAFGSNVINARGFEGRRQLAKIGTPVNRLEWAFSPPTVNAFYNPNNNEITFPAGILQPPFFDAAADDAVNYGGIGGVIGHELTHGFDDEGRQFDAAGNLRDWWTAEDAARFSDRARRVVTQFKGYVAVDTLHVNGELTLGENIADLGGLAIAFDAFQRSLAGKPAPPAIDGFTAEQRFFLAAGQVWRSLTRQETARLRALTDPHSPPRWRVNGPMSNIPAFAKAFGCKPGDPMVRPDSVRAEIW